MRPETYSILGRRPGGPGEYGRPYLGGRWGGSSQPQERRDFRPREILPGVKAHIMEIPVDWDFFQVDMKDPEAALQRVDEMEQELEDIIRRVTNRVHYILPYNSLDLISADAEIENRSAQARAKIAALRARIERARIASTVSETQAQEEPPAQEETQVDLPQEQQKGFWNRVAACLDWLKTQ